MYAAFDVEFFDEIEKLFGFERFHVYFIKLTFHRQHINFVFRVGQMRHRRSQPHILNRINRANVAFGINDVRAEKSLIRRVVNVTVGERADDRSRMLVHLHLFVEPEKSRAFTANVRDIGDKP